MKSKGSKKKLIGIILTTAVLLVLLLLCYRGLRGHGMVDTEVLPFVESSKGLDNPNRGFYYINGFEITDEYVDYRQEIAKRFANDDETTLSLILINIASYNKGPISEDGLENVEKILEQLARYDKHYIIRILYDWDGEAESNEPKSIDIIQTHMEQLGPILSEYDDRIFTLQGVFVGQGGEMHGTPYVEPDNLKLLVTKLAEVTPEDMYLSVRTPVFWRTVTESSDELENRLGLFNDGMLGSVSDYGTYGSGSKEKDGPYVSWNREEELLFQEELCTKVPNGGEVIVDNSYNDFDNALADMKQMHISYLNRGYDLDVYSKWSNTTIDFDDAYVGMSGLDYMERHLGYRLLIDSAEMKYAPLKDKVTVFVNLKNVGFAPIYKECEAWIILYNGEDGVMEGYLLEEDVRRLSGGTDSDTVLSMSQSIALFGKKKGQYQVYYKLIDKESNALIELANESEPTENGYLLGTITLK